MDKKKKRNIIIGVVIAFILIFLISMGSVSLLAHRTVLTSDERSGVSATGQRFSGVVIETSFLSINLYDKFGNLLTPDNAQYIVNGISGVVSMTVTATITNTGTYALTCNLHSTNPAEYSVALPSPIQKIINIGTSGSWTSDMITIPETWADTTQRLEVYATCSYNPGTGVIILPDEFGYVDMIITSETGSGSFGIAVTSGGIGTEWCGDGTCQDIEDVDTCPDDCGSPTAQVTFRTSDSTYASGAEAIAFIGLGMCGDPLVGYGYVSSYSGFLGTCIDAFPTKVTGCGTASLLLSNLPGGWREGGDAPALYSCSDKVGSLYVCDIASGTSYIKGYSTADGDAGSVSIDSVSTQDPALELEC